MRRRWLVAIIVVVVIVAGVLAIPLSRDVVVGLVAGEVFYESRPLRYWLRMLRSGDARQREQAAHKAKLDEDNAVSKKRPGGDLDK